jgi:CspA family cold shock protein
MGKGRDRGPRRRDFDDGEYTPPPSYQLRSPQPTSRDAAGPAIDVTVKWFNPEKGFGFVELADGTGDAFLHINALLAAGHDAIAPGALLRVQVGQGAKGRQVTAVLEVKEGAAPPSNQRTAQSSAVRPALSAARQRVDTSAAITVSGIVKWFNPEKAFGFIVADDGLKDVFVHSSVVAQAGMPSLVEGQRVTMQVIATSKGREAVSIASAG